ncbi:hypothetical protein [Acanthopleuribacter pedis]|uniref:Uncharacterized protein n=1 Tax=Acanthopleuribacter pedis TaxID=442870 RepID=A0A8J7U4C1_9BACT|nr:hypothetical protein [Acanthopleuribacter pedis]MBO1318126.1 hypothetical protein [Acanthopleuribacter pedis]
MTEKGSLCEARLRKNDLIEGAAFFQDEVDEVALGDLAALARAVFDPRNLILEEGTADRCSE